MPVIGICLAIMLMGGVLYYCLYDEEPECGSDRVEIGLDDVISVDRQEESNDIDELQLPLKIIEICDSPSKRAKEYTELVLEKIKGESKSLGQEEVYERNAELLLIKPESSDDNLRVLSGKVEDDILGVGIDLVVLSEQEESQELTLISEIVETYNGTSSFVSGDTFSPPEEVSQEQQELVELNNCFEDIGQRNSYSNYFSHGLGYEII
ncbi:MAG: hypothetical protein P857_1062 [Candidatus Xenolissoclinum pacificiensis L6]|uniref:Uncharacterized protein n=1 Tax=Candidatus Xenolissoclinum pacificiensis L6 TaxID=1401685 RepID=W2V2J8_9RICK|nr:MAG: hypothetical protein P857_1062 [Candidatus Xenolissoclinum pacificiensis L6]